MQLGDALDPRACGGRRFVDKIAAAEATFRRDLVAREIPLGRRGRAEEQAAAIAFLASEDASFITGQIPPVGGGAAYPF
jgi:NAD(P)-dependent dehydrogenase (short-subunit alcohol dehydrogenase family)